MYLNSSVGWFKRAWQELCAEAKKSGPDTRRLSKKGEAMKWGVYVFTTDEGPALFFTSEGRLKIWVDKEYSFFNNSLEIP